MGKKGKKEHFTKISKILWQQHDKQAEREAVLHHLNHPPWLHRNTRAMPTLQTHSFPLFSAMLHYTVISQAQRGTAPLSPHDSRVPAYSLPARLSVDPDRVCTAPQASGHTDSIRPLLRKHWQVCTHIILRLFLHQNDLRLHDISQHSQLDLPHHEFMTAHFSPEYVKQKMYIKFFVKSI